MTDLKSSLDAQVSNGNLLQTSADNIVELIEGSKDPLCRESVSELVENGEWSELNDRFFRKLAFGTGGLRGRTIGRIITKAERGTPQALDRPQFPCVGTNAMNFYNLSRATQGLVRYLKKHVGDSGKPSIVLGNDTRHFGREFADFCAKIATAMGCDAYVFKSPRSTPEVSFAIRHLGATGGVVLTASHNPPHDNGYKAYFADGAQITEPHASGIIAEVNAIQGDSFDPLPEPERGTITEIGAEIDDRFVNRLQDLALQPELIKNATGLKIVYTNLHGTGGVLIPRILRELGFQCFTVPEQDTHDGRFPTVESPNPENAPALKMGVELAKKEGADLVIGTDPDCDRMGAFVRDDNGELVAITGNQIGSLLAWYRTKTLFDLGVLNDENKSHSTLIKTLVTTRLQDAIAERYGVGCVNTLTGFKYIGSKLTKYELAIPEEKRSNYRQLTEPESRTLRLAESKYFIFGGEESYGYLGCDFIRDKDGNGSVMMLCELAAYARSENKSIIRVLDDIYSEYGYYTERLHTMLFEGAEGAAKISALAESYGSSPPSELDGSAVTVVRNYANDDFVDEEGDPIPKEKMLFVELADGRSFAVRPSGTEPKIKYYLYIHRPAGEDLAKSESVATMRLESLWESINADAEQRLG